MSGLETLPPDQRAVLQLILVQGRGYADLAATLRLDAAAVRERAHAGAAALAPSGGGPPLDAAVRARVVDYLLGQQDDGERIVTFAELGESPAACRWAQELREQLAPVASGELPEVPASATVAAAVNGSRSVAAAHEPAPVTAALAPSPPAPPVGDAPGAPASAPQPAAPGEPGPPRPSRLGGAILIAGALALAVVLAIVLIGGGDDGGSPSATTSAQPQARASARTQTSATGTSARAQVRTVGGAVLRPPAGGDALGAALVQQTTDGRRLLALEAARLPGNGAQEFYGIWLRGSAGDRFLGFVPRQVRADGTFTVSSQLASGLDLSAYTTVLVTTEGSSAVPATPGATVLSGPLRLAG
ncbi:MAG TPA: sigma factor-like helix-turn-helix DNA-binding protein [Conexibacter sp.]